MDDDVHAPRCRRPPARRPLATLAALLVGAGALLAGGAAARAAGTPAAVSGPVLKPPRIPVAGAYLGLDPNFAPRLSTAVQAHVFESRTGRILGIVSYYTAFGALPSLADVLRVENSGSLPMINMNCGAPDPSIVAGRRDREIRAVARVLAHYGKPVLFRWFWEMNLPDVNGHAACLAGAGGPGYVAAYRHIWQLFQDAGARNVAFVWCPSDAHSATHQLDNTFWPGSTYVDWVAADLYDRTTATGTFGQQFAPFYEHWTQAAPGKPIMVAETGAAGAATQLHWLAQIAAALTTGDRRVPDAPFSEVRAVVYVDAIDVYDYVLHRAAAGFEEFTDLAHEPYFSLLPADAPRPPASSRRPAAAAPTAAVGSHAV